MRLKNYLKTQKPWGYFEQFTLNEPVTVKLLFVKAGQRLSYQSHENRKEFWRCLKGPFKVIINDKEIILSEGEEISIPQGSKHRLIALDNDAHCLEISFGIFDEEDIIRYEDDYNR